MSDVATKTMAAVTVDTSTVHDQSSNSYQMNKLPYTDPYGVSQSSSSVMNSPHQFNYHQHQAHQTNPLHHMHQLDQLVHPPIHPANHVHQAAPMLTHQVNPVYPVNPAQVTRHLHHYNPTRINGPTQVNTSYPHTADALLHHYQPDQMHVMHPQQLHYYNNSAYSFKH